MSENIEHQKGLGRTLRRMLRPLVRLLIRQGVAYPAMVETLRETYVEVASEDPRLQLPGKRQTDSRVSLLTGVHRKEVKRIRETLQTAPDEPEIRSSVSAQMMALWLGHADFQDEQGQPRPLGRSPEQSPSFYDLVYAVSMDKHPRSILDEWLHQHLVHVDEDGWVHLDQAGFVARGAMQDKLFFAGRNIGEHLETVTHNLETDEDPRFDRAVYYHHLSEDSVAELRKMAEDGLLRVLKQVNHRAAELQQRDKVAHENESDGIPRPNASIHVGGYLSIRHDGEERP
ncbi:MAG: hypothetical protein D6698_02200 [Gammaproteobacteria bacterium]|nr:MAG: hypothetical protein D6698_02200 [Gammaproteobacteria bacterium]